MNRSELVRVVAERAGSDETAARRHVDAVFDAVMEGVSAGERVTVTGFGTFDRLSRPARSARNPRTGVPVAVPAAEVPRFRSGQTFRNLVAQSVPAGAEEQAVAAAAEPDAVVTVAVEPGPRKAKKGGKKGKKAAEAKKAAVTAPKKQSAAAKKGTGAKKAPKKADAGKADAGKGGAGKGGATPPSKKKPGKAKARAKAAG